MGFGIELARYEPSYLHAAAQAVREILANPPMEESLSLGDILSQLTSESTREGFNGVLAQLRGEVIGLISWFAIDGFELNDRWRPRFVPRNKVPTFEGQGIMVAQFGIVPSIRGKGLGRRLFARALEEIGTGQGWIAGIAPTNSPAAHKLLANFGFELLDLTGVQHPERAPYVKIITQPETVN